jgi:hypothetical protein
MVSETMTDELYTGTIEDGAMIDAPVYEHHRRGKNWMAIITANPTAPGGLARQFVEHVGGRYYYIVSPDLVGKPVEFGADYYSASENRSPKRWYGVVRAVTDASIAIEHYSTATQAIKAAQGGPERAAMMSGSQRPPRAG